MRPDRAVFPPTAPQDILMLKGHSAGVGDLLRSSAAWRALRNRFPHARLHLWFLSVDPGAASEELIARHHLLASFRVSDKRTATLAKWFRLLREGLELARATRPELILDFESNGIRTPLLTWRLGLAAGARTVGIAEVPFRGIFYQRAAPSRRRYALRHNLPFPLDYTERDFVALAPLGLERRGLPIELEETEEGRLFRQQLLKELSAATAARCVGLNIGCATPGAAYKRPNLDLLAGFVGELQRRHGFCLVLTGAPYEREINRQFLSGYRPAGPVIDLAGRTNMLELAGAIRACALFISSDSGPYHMGVGLRVPTLAIFVHPNPIHYHRHAWVECVAARGPDDLPVLLNAAERLLPPQ